MSILSKIRDNSEAIYKVEADVIVTSTIVGFSATRILQNQPFSFDMESPADWAGMPDTGKDSKAEFIEQWQMFLDALSSISEVIRGNGLDASKVKDAQSPDWEPGAIITGRAGGASSGGRHMSVKSVAARQSIEEEAYFPVGYSGRGAYTGTIDDPCYDHTFRQPTKRRVITDRKRWNPGVPYWGLILGHLGLASPNLDPDPKIGMGPFKPGWDGQRGVVAYTHGMSWAMREAVRHGPWCTPYEIATGSGTTKMASCFPCTTYMYAAGFPPSSIHLGRGESWAPLPDDDGDDEYQAISRSINARWNIDVHHYLELGARMMTGRCATTAHERALGLLREALDRTPLLEGGNLLLDAITVHDSDWKRIGRTLRKVSATKSSSMFA